jgi:hypothetical protein
MLICFVFLSRLHLYVPYCSMHTAFYCAALHCILLCCALLNCAVLYFAILHFIVLHCTTLYCDVLNCTALSCSVLYCTVLSVRILFRRCVILIYTTSKSVSDYYYDTLQFVEYEYEYISDYHYEYFLTVIISKNIKFCPKASRSQPASNKISK